MVNTIVQLKELFISFLFMTSIATGISLIVLDIANNNSFSMLLFVSVFAQSSPQQQIQIDYNSLQISDRGQIQGNIIMGTTTTSSEKKEDTTKIIQDKPIHTTIKAIGIGQTSIHCLNINDNKHEVRTSQPFLATAQKSMTVIQTNTAFTLQLNPTEGNVNCDKLSVVTGPTTTFSNVAFSLSSQ